MKSNHGFIKETIVTKIMELIALNVHAEEPETKDPEPTKEPETKDPDPSKEPGNEPTKSPTINYEDLISKARKEEKDKLYPKISALEKDKEALVEKHNTALLKIGELETQIDELNKKLQESGKDESQELKDLKAKLTSAEGELKTLKESTVEISEVEKRVREEVEAEYEVKLYREQKLREAGDNVIPELVTGSTKEEIDASLVSAQERFNDIVSKANKGYRNISPTNVSQSKMNTKDFNLTDLAKLDPRSAEYAEMRKKLGLK